MMKKGTKIAAMLLGLALVIPACNLNKGQSEAPAPSSEQPSESESQSESEELNYQVSISNKEGLQAEWFAGEGSRKVEIATEPRANVAQLVSEGKITISSSNSEVASVAGQMVSAVGAGSATITVACGQSTDTVELTIKAQRTNKEIYGTQHEGTAADPFDNEDAVKVGKWAKDNGDTPALYVKGTIASFYHSPGERTDGAVSWFLEPAEGQTEKFEVYKCYKAEGTGEEKYLTDDDVWVGGEAVAYGPITWYASGSQAEFTGSTFVSCEGNKPQPRQEIEATVAEALTAGKALDDGSQSWDYYIVTGYVVKKSGYNFFMAGSKTASTTNDKDLLEIYSAAAPAYADLLLRHAKVTIKMTLKNYHGQVENGLALTREDITVDAEEPGSEWVEHAEPAVTERTLAEFIAGENVKTVAYSVTAQIKAFKSGDTKDKYGNMTITDGTNDLVMYGVSGTATALAWDVYGASYIFTNPQDFMTNEVTKDLAVGDTITLKMIRADYTKNGVTTIQGSGVVTSVGGGEEPPALTNTLKITKANSGVGTTTLTEAKQVTYEVLAGNIVLEWSAGCFDYGNYDEVGVGKNGGYLKVVSLPTGYQISTLVLDFFQYENAKVYASQGGAEIAKTGDSGNSGLNKSVLNTYNINGASFYIGNDSTYNQAFYSFEITLVEGQEQVALPVGNYSGHITAADDSQMFTTIALGNEAAYVEVGSNIKFTTTYTFDAQQQLVTIVHETYGNFTAVYDAENNALKQITAPTAVAALIKNNGQITLNGAAIFYDCEGSAAEVNAIFGRRVRSSSWEATLQDVTVTSEHVIGGEGAVVLEGSTSYNAIGLTLRSDLAAASGSNIGFWVYNPSSNDVRMQSYYYKGAGYTSYQDFYPTAKAGEWTYYRTGTAAFYNFTLADFTKSGVNFVIDNIAIF